MMHNADLHTLSEHKLSLFLSHTMLASFSYINRINLCDFFFFPSLTEYLSIYFI